MQKTVTSENLLNKPSKGKCIEDKKIILFWVFFGSFIMSELLVRIWSVRPFFGIGLLLIFMFALAWALFFYGITLVIPKKYRLLFGSLTLFITAILASAQLVYYSYFKTYLSVFSATQAGEVAHFWKDILLEIGKSAIPIFLCFLIPVLFVIMNASFQKELQKDKGKIKVFAASLLVFLAIFLVVMVSGGGPNTPKDALFKTNAIGVSIPNLGVGTGMLLDGGRLIFGFNPNVSIFTEWGTGEAEDDKPEYPYNKMDIDFTKLAEEETDSTVKLMHQYFGNQTPTRQNEKTGIFKGKNFVFVCGESFSSYAVNEKYTPTLYKLATEGYNFTNFYNPIWGVSTSDGEYVQSLGLIPKAGIWSLRSSTGNWLPFSMGNQFSKLGYQTRAYHNHYAEYYGRTESHPNLGYIYKGLGTGLKVKEQWPESDVEMIQLTTSEFIGKEPWHTYFMTVSGHKNYTWAGNMMCRRHQKDVADLEMSENCKAYVACNMELDLALELLIKRLDEAGELENTVIALSGDHYPYGLTNEEASEFLGHTVEPDFELYKSTFILWTPNMEPETVDKYTGTIDIIPTISNMFGLEYDSRLLSGRDIFSDASSLVMFSDKSWITEKGRYSTRTGESQAFNDDGKIELEGPGLESEYIKNINELVYNRFYFASLILDMDYYRRVIDRWEAPGR